MKEIKIIYIYIYIYIYRYRYLIESVDICRWHICNVMKFANY